MRIGSHAGGVHLFTGPGQASDVAQLLAVGIAIHLMATHR
jgi:hypothetical protein